MLWASVRILDGVRQRLLLVGIGAHEGNKAAMNVSITSEVSFSLGRLQVLGEELPEVLEVFNHIFRVFVLDSIRGGEFLSAAVVAAL